MGIVFEAKKMYILICTKESKIICGDVGKRAKNQKMSFGYVPWKGIRERRAMRP